MPTSITLNVSHSSFPLKLKVHIFHQDNQFCLRSFGKEFTMILNRDSSDETALLLKTIIDDPELNSQLSFHNTNFSCY